MVGQLRGQFRRQIGDHAVDQDHVIGTLGGALLLAELQLGLSILSPGAYVQQIFLGAVTIGAVALDLFLTKLRKSRTS